MAAACLLFPVLMLETMLEKGEDAKSESLVYRYKGSVRWGGSGDGMRARKVKL
jgi:hypothetical protein